MNKKRNARRGFIRLRSADSSSFGVISPRPTHPRRRGFTLIELLLVVVIIGILAAIVVPRLTGKQVDAQIAAAKQQISIFQGCLERYHLDNNTFPSAEQGLAALVAQPSGEPEAKNWKGPYLSSNAVPKDPWGNEYAYAATDANNFDIRSMGPDGKDGTEDDILKP